TITSGDVISLTVIDSGLTGGQKSISHTVQGTDTTTTIATSLKNAINADSSLQAINVSATSSANVITIVSHSSHITTYAKTVTAAPAPETLALSSMSNVTNYGYNPANQLLTISAPGTARFQGSTSKALKSAAVQTQVVSLTPSTVPVPTYSTNVGDTTVIMTLGRDYKNGYRSVVLTGGPYSASAGKDVSITIFAQGLPGGQQTVSHTLASNSDYGTVSMALANAINNNSNLQAVKISATSSSTFQYGLVNIFQQRTSYAVSVTSGNATMTLGALKDDGSQPVTMGGGPYGGGGGGTANVTATNSALPGGQRVISYQIQAIDTYETVAFKLAAAINADAQMQSIHMSAKAQGGTFTITSTAANNTVYAGSVSSGATEMISFRDYAFGTSPATIGGKATSGDTLTLTVKHPALSGGQTAVNYVVQSGDTLASIAAGLASAINGSSALQAIGVSATNSAAATLPWSQQFHANALLPTGTSHAKVSAIDGLNNTVTNNHHLTVTGPAGKQLTFDANGNMTSDGERAYLWDAQNRLWKILYPSNYFGDFTEFVYDGVGRCVKIIEYSNFTLTSTKQSVWDRYERCEERDSVGSLTKRFFTNGETVGAASYLTLRDHLGSVREVTDGSSNVQSRYTFEPFGSPSKLDGSLDSDFLFAGYYFHARSGLHMPTFRSLNTGAGRWLNRDPMGEGNRRARSLTATSGSNLYAYVGNNPVNWVDPKGLFRQSWKDCIDCCNANQRTHVWLCNSLFPKGSPQRLACLLIAKGIYVECVWGCAVNWDYCQQYVPGCNEREPGDQTGDEEGGSAPEDFNTWLKNFFPF
ncbi:MAG TPA: RHS repeat-associated core domain-containing protein, partial [Candidatus Obscuribacterales bacterium]